MRILVLGGYGNFGARICRALARDGIEVIAAGRDPNRGHQSAKFDASIGKAQVDIADKNLEARIRSIAPDIVIHCAGPFQSQHYNVALASLAAGAHYIDLADGRAFVTKFSAEVDPIAKSANRLAVSGASTVPALSSAVVDHVADRFRSIEEIQIYIAPAQHAPRGEATMRAVFSYAGRPFQWLRDGTWRTVYGWQELRRLRFADLGTRWAAACDVPDLELFPVRYPTAKTVEFRAALEVGIQHFLFAGVSQIRRWGIPVPLDKWAVTLDRFAGFLDRFGTERGGMLISVTGARTDGKRGRIDWHLTADNNHGPEIPCMPAILLSKKLMQGKIALRGAMPCMGLLTLDEFAPEFARWGIRAKFEEASL
jgi:saccharopine dehydrogenase-like protein